LEAQSTAQRTFEQGAAAAGLPTIELARAELDAGIPLFALLVKAGLAESNGEARKLVRGNGARINDEVASDEKLTVTSGHLKDGVVKLSAGKKRHVLVRVAQ
jgi:tyrosyl-tRNA synthetase